MVGKNYIRKKDLPRTLTPDLFENYGQALD